VEAATVTADSVDAGSVNTGTANATQEYQRSGVGVSDEGLYEKVATGADATNGELQVDFIAGTKIVVQRSKPNLYLRFTADDAAGEYEYLTRDRTGAHTTSAGQNQVALVDNADQTASGIWRTIRDWVDRPIVVNQGAFSWRPADVCVGGYQDADAADTIRLIDPSGTFPGGERVKIYQPISGWQR
jgi:hypothetical protein